MRTQHDSIFSRLLPCSASLAFAPAFARGPVPDPAVKDFQRVVDAAYAKYKDLKDGKNADYIPILTETPSDLFGVVIVTKDGKVYSAGDVDYQFSIQSVSKPFTAALVMSQQGPQVLKDKIGVEPTGMAFNSKLALAVYENSVNPLVNAGAIAAVSLVQASSEADRWNQVSQNLSDFAGRPLTVLEKVYESEYTTAFGNRGIANLLYNWGRLYSDPEEALRVYTRECSVGVSAKDLGMMGATLANGGVNPLIEEAGHAGEARAGAAGDHGHRGLLRRIRRLDVHRRTAGEDRRGRRHRRRRAGTFRHRSVLAALERSRQQRPLAECDP